MILHRNRLGRKKRANRTSPIRQMSFGFPYIYICFDNLLTQQYSIIKRHVSNFFSCHNISSFKILKPSELLRSYMKNLRKYKILCSTPPETTEYRMVILCFLFYMFLEFTLFYLTTRESTHNEDKCTCTLFLFCCTTQKHKIFPFSIRLVSLSHRHFFS